MSHDSPKPAINSRLPDPKEIKGHYNQLLKELDGGYLQHRWGDSEITRRHFRQTELAMIHGLGLSGTSGRFLEIGCGPAVWTTLFLAPARSVELVDISEEMLNQARERIGKWDGGAHASKVTYLCGDFLELDIPAASFDTIVTARAFEYMSNKAAFIAKCFSLLRPGGKLLLVTKNRKWHDSVKSTRALVNAPREELPVGQAMQLDLVDSHQTREMFANAGFANPVAYPVILGTFEINILASSPALAMIDLLHRSIYRRQLGSVTGLVNSLVESFLVLGWKPSQSR